GETHSSSCGLYHIYLDSPSSSSNLTFSLHDALPISCWRTSRRPMTTTTREASSAAGSIWPSTIWWPKISVCRYRPSWAGVAATRSEEHTSELQSREKLVCRLLLENK